jgi:hypothetical protein
MLRLADDEGTGGHAPRTIRGADESPGVSGSDALASQVGGDHYRKLAIQPVHYIHANKLDFLQGNIVKYATRHKDKGGAEDVRKIIHYARLILELEYGETD